MRLNHSIPAALALALCGCADPHWDVDQATIPRAWATHPATKHWTHPHIYYELHSATSTATAYVRPSAFFLPCHIETGQMSEQRGDYGNWITDITFHGVTDRYLAHYTGRDMDFHAVLTVVPRDYKPR